MTHPDSCPVVKIVGQKSAGNPLGFREINKSDFNPETHELYEGPETVPGSDAAGDQGEAKQGDAEASKPASSAPGAEVTPAPKPIGWNTAPPA